MVVTSICSLSKHDVGLTVGCCIFKILAVSLSADDSQRLSCLGLPILTKVGMSRTIDAQDLIISVGMRTIRMDVKALVGAVDFIQTEIALRLKHESSCLQLFAVTIGCDVLEVLKECG